MEKKITVSFSKRQSETDKLKVIKYSEERSIQAVFNYYAFSRPTIRYLMKENEVLMKVTKIWVMLHCIKVD